MLFSDILTEFRGRSDEIRVELRLILMKLMDCEKIDCNFVEVASKDWRII